MSVAQLGVDESRDARGDGGVECGAHPSKSGYSKSCLPVGWHRGPGTEGRICCSDLDETILSSLPLFLIEKSCLSLYPVQSLSVLYGFLRRSCLPVGIT